MIFKQSSAGTNEHAPPKAITNATEANALSETKVTEDREAQHTKSENMDKGLIEGPEDHARGEQKDQVKIITKEQEEVKTAQTTSKPSFEEMEVEDELADIDGMKPNVYMKDGEEREIASMTRLTSPFSCLANFTYICSVTRNTWSDVTGITIIGEL